MKLLSYEDFFEEMWDYVSSKIVDDHYYFDHEDMMRAISLDVYEIYKSSPIHPKFYARTVESLFFNLFKFEDKGEIDGNKL